MLTVLALAVEPTLQQVLASPTQTTTLQNETASLGIAGTAWTSSYGYIFADFSPYAEGLASPAIVQPELGRIGACRLQRKALG